MLADCFVRPENLEKFRTSFSKNFEIKKLNTNNSFKPPFSVKHPKQDYDKSNHHGNHERVAIGLPEFRDVSEIHAVDAGDQS